MEINEENYGVEGGVREGSLTKTVEKQTAKIPSLVYMALAGKTILSSS